MASPTTKISARTFTLSQRLYAAGGDTSFTVSKNSTDVFTVTSGVLWIGQGTKAEWAYFGGCSVSSTSITFTSVVRGLKPNATSTSDNDTALQYDHAIGEPVVYVQHSVDINTYLQKNADDVISGSLDFSGTSTFKLKLPGFTTAQRNALTSSDREFLFNSTTGELQYFSGGSWYTVSAGSTQPLASSTVAGRSKLDVEAADPANPIAAGINSPHVLDTTSTTTTGQIKIANNTTGSRSATLSLHSDDTYTSGGDIIQRANTGVNAATTWTHRGTGELKLYLQEAAGMYIAGGVMKLDYDIVRTFTAGETVVAGNLVYMKNSDSKIYKAQNTTIEKVSFVGIVIVGGNTNDTIVVQTSGIYVTTGLTAGSSYWVDSSAGAITVTTTSHSNVGVIPYQVGIALSTTQLLLRPSRKQRVIPFSGSRTTVSGSGTQTVTIGGATAFSILRAEITSTEVYPCVGSYDAVAGTNYYCTGSTTGGGSGSGFCCYTVDGSGYWTATGGTSGNDLTLSWTRNSAANTVYFAGLVYELI